MATLSTEKYDRKDGTTSTTYRVLIGGGKRQRQTVRLGDVSEKIANEAKSRIEALETAKLTGTSVDRTTAAWVSAISDGIHEKLARVGLVEPRAEDEDGDERHRHGERREDRERAERAVHGVAWPEGGGIVRREAGGEVSRAR
jgi:hypothetical protein